MDADLTEVEWSLIQVLRSAEAIYRGGDEGIARRLMCDEAIPLMAACVQNKMAVYGPLTGALDNGIAEA